MEKIFSKDLNSNINFDIELCTNLAASRFIIISLDDLPKMYGTYMAKKIVNDISNVHFLSFSDYYYDDACSCYYHTIYLYVDESNVIIHTNKDYFLMLVNRYESNKKSIMDGLVSVVRCERYDVLYKVNDRIYLITCNGVIKDEPSSTLKYCTLYIYKDYMRVIKSDGKLGLVRFSNCSYRLEIDDK